MPGTLRARSEGHGDNVGGGGGNRTRVRKHVPEDPYVRVLSFESRLLELRQAGSPSGQPECSLTVSPQAKDSASLLLMTPVSAPIGGIGTDVTALRRPKPSSDRWQLFFPAVLRGNGTSARSLRFDTSVEPFRPHDGVRVAAAGAARERHERSGRLLPGVYHGGLRRFHVAENQALRTGVLSWRATWARSPMRSDPGPQAVILGSARAGKDQRKCAPPGNRTPNLLVKSQLLYQLS